MDKDTLNLIIGGVVILLIIITAIAQQSKLDDPADLTVIYTHQLDELVKLTAGRLKTIRAKTAARSACLLSP
ncbi:hypothetical protein HUF18_12925 [Thalassolituus sp. ST750PaO-4]|uniref:hypothetical protein n=1 Tax=Thalassolituus sp. ST750PaO-4 TaxID=2742965 RepID=UPI001CE25EF9|nr:hypothetical protein [Thalassolituus sp. ST750PaO-4]MCA6060687.1 hypothetical protein [Thalassolituus sp. ST750PaO-4]